MSVAMTSQRLAEVAETYRSRGYEVVIEPRGEQLPDFLLRYRPDLLARKDGEAVVVEVKSRTSLARANDLRELALAVQSHPGWKLDLVVTNPQGFAAEDVADSLSEQDVRRITVEAAELLQENRTEAALLLAWSAAEAALRRVAFSEGLQLEQKGPLYLLTQLATNALISRDDYRLLIDAHESRNRVAHGFDLPDRGRYVEATRQLLELTERLPETVS